MQCPPNSKVSDTIATTTGAWRLDQCQCQKNTFMKNGLCGPCPLGGKCPVGFPVEPLPGYFRGKNDYNHMYKCITQKNCLGTVNSTCKKARRS